MLLAFGEVENSLVSLRQDGLRTESERQRVDADRKVLELTGHWNL